MDNEKYKNYLDDLGTIAKEYARDNKAKQHRHYGAGPLYARPLLAAL
ncbi:hypothetical protein K0H59_03270 [Shewanella sp. FJAT-51649]|nr:hypothetical protein [Shewanella sp. FJAT-51649]QYJ72085.1 hypothetical protein K0H59_03270 [Shewanella sp. FJAT-51649]